MTRELQLETAANARDLGGLALREGGVTRMCRILRMGSPDDLTAGDWSTLSSVGVRLRVDLRNASEIGSAGSQPPQIETVLCPLEDPGHPEYSTTWNQRWAEPDFYAWSVLEHPELWAAAIAAIADAPSGAVLVHCAGGRDRTGMISALLLDAAGVERSVVLEDYVAGIMGAELMKIRPAHNGERTFTPAELDSIAADWRAALDLFLDEVDIPAALRAAGYPDELLARAAARLR